MEPIFRYLNILMIMPLLKEINFSTFELKQDDIIT
jgi:hypothetical protein